MVKDKQEEKPLAKGHFPFIKMDVPPGCGKGEGGVVSWEKPLISPMFDGHGILYDIPPTGVDICPPIREEN